MRFIIAGLLLLAGWVGAPQAENPPLQFAELGDLELVGGGVLEDVRLGYRTAGELNADGSNAILFPTWFGGTSGQLLAVWSPWIDTDRFFLIIVDALGNGVSTSPSNSEAQPGQSFPRIGIRDMVNSQHRLLTEVLGVDRLHAVVGVSMGGMQTFEWIVAYPDFVDRAVPVVGSPRLNGYDLLLWTTQLDVIEGAYACDCRYDEAGEIVSMVATLATWSPPFHARETPHEDAEEFIAGAKRGGRSIVMLDYAAQLRAMINHDVSADVDGSLEAAAGRVRAEVLNVVGLQDHMVTPWPALRFAAMLGAESISLESDCGHLASSCEAAIVDPRVREFLGC